MNAVPTTLATLLVPGVACFVVPYYILRATHQPVLRAMGVAQIAAMPLAAVGLAMVVWVSFSFVRHGRGTPVPIDPPKHFVSHGLYRWVRNPMYVGALLVLLAVVIFYGSLWILIYTAGLWAALHTFTVLLEEPQLKQRFGEPYEEYQNRVPRWIPRPPEGWRASARP
jgi:protein-S-isoprenylcysteine O-methyltransferase Ste14